MRILNYLKENKTIVLSILGVVFIILVFFSLIIYSLSPKPKTTRVVENQNPSQPLNYDLDGQKKLLKYLSSPEKLNDKDLAIKKAIISSLGDRSGVIHSSPIVELDYIKSADLFEANIKTINFDEAKNEIIDLLKSKGLSQKGICNLPLMFSVGWSVSEKSVGVRFSPLPPGC